MAKEGGFFSPNAKKDNRIAANKQPLAPIGSDDYNKEVEGFIQDFKNDFIYRDKFDVDTGERKDKYGRPIPGQRFGISNGKRRWIF